MNETLSNVVRNELQRLSRAQAQDTQPNQILYALEGFLNRLALSDEPNAMVLKGGLVLAAYNQRRPTTDADFAARGFSNNQAHVKHRVEEILSITIDDGLVFHSDTLRIEIIRENAAYFGQRLAFEVSLAKSKVTLKVDINFGDEIFPDVKILDYLPLLPHFRKRFQISAYPIELVTAENFVTMLRRLSANTRLKDLADIAGLLPLANLETLAISIRRVAASQDVEDFEVEEQLENWAESQEDLWIEREAKNYPQLAGKNFLEIFREVARVIFPALQGLDK